MRSSLRWALVGLGVLTGGIATPAVAQGTILFSTRAGGVVNAPVVYIGDGSLADDRFRGQLYAGPLGGPLGPIGDPQPFRGDVGRGYITAGGIVEVPGVPPGSTAEVKLVAWASWHGTSYVEALAKGMGDIGESAIIQIDLGGGIQPPAMLLGLQGFGVSPLIPEASAAFLAMLGFGVLACFRQPPRDRRSHGIGDGESGPTN